MSEKDAAADPSPPSDDTSGETHDEAHDEAQASAEGSAPERIDVEPVDSKVEDVRESLRALMRERQISQREVETRCHWTRGYLSQVLQGRITLTLFHVLAVLRAVDEPWPEFFQRLFPTQEPLDLDEIRSRLDRYDGLFEELRRQGLIEGDHSTGQARPEL